MTALSPALDAALSADNVTIFGALTLAVGGDTMHLLDGSSDLLIGGQLFTGEDATYGTWGSMESFEDGSGDEAPGLSVMLLPRDNAAALALSGPSMQGKAVQIRIGARNDATGAVIGEPYLLFDGEVDVTKHEFGKNMLQVSLDCVGGMERFFFNDEGIKLAPTFHQQVWPGELASLIHDARFSGPLWAFAAAGGVARTTGIAGVCFTAIGLMGFSG